MKQHLYIMKSHQRSKPLADIPWAILIIGNLTSYLMVIPIYVGKWLNPLKPRIWVQKCLFCTVAGRIPLWPPHRLTSRQAAFKESNWKLPAQIWSWPVGALICSLFSEKNIIELSIVRLLIRISTMLIFTEEPHCLILYQLKVVSYL